MFSKYFKNYIVSNHGGNGIKWLNSVPNLVQKCSYEWSLYNIRPFENLSYNYVAMANQVGNSKKVVLKLGFSFDSIEAEIKALKYYQGHGCTNLLAFNQENSALLREHASGVSIKHLFPEQERTTYSAITEVIKHLHFQATPENFQDYPLLQDWFHSFNLVDPAILGKEHVTRAQQISASLLSSTQREIVLLHGDLHHDNLFFNVNNTCIAIDPKGVIGDPAYEICTFIRNPMPLLLREDTAEAIINYRLDYFSDSFGISREELEGWCYAQSVLSACWALEDNQDWKQWISSAKLLQKISTNKFGTIYCLGKHNNISHSKNLEAPTENVDSQKEEADTTKVDNSNSNCSNNDNLECTNNQQNSYTADVSNSIVDEFRKTTIKNVDTIEIKDSDTEIIKGIKDLLLGWLYILPESLQNYLITTQYVKTILEIIKNIENLLSPNNLFDSISKELSQSPQEKFEKEHPKFDDDSFMEYALKAATFELEHQIIDTYDNINHEYTNILQDHILTFFVPSVSYNDNLFGKGLCLGESNHNIFGSDGLHSL